MVVIINFESTHLILRSRGPSKLQFIFFLSQFVCHKHIPKSSNPQLLAPTSKPCWICQNPGTWNFERRTKL